jgi:hypothetical protein
VTLLVENRLTGENGTPVSNETLAATSSTGTVTIQAPGSRATYDTTHTLHDLPAIRVQSGHHRTETPQLQVGLPRSGPWSARWYMWVPQLQDTGHGTGEVRSVAAFDNTAWVVHATNAGNVGTRLHQADLAAPSISWDDQAGSATGLGQWLRAELRHDGSDLVSRVFTGHSTADARIHTWKSRDPGRTLAITGYRWRRRATLYWGDQGAEVRELQLELIDLGYDLGMWGADGDFGNATYNAVVSFQTTRGLSPADGVPGPETRAAMDLALGRVPPPLWVSELAVADGQLIGPVEPPPLDPVRRSRLVLGMRI